MTYPKKFVLSPALSGRWLAGDRAIHQQMLTTMVADAEQRLLHRLLDRELANWRQQPWLRDLVQLKTQKTGGTKRVAVYINGRCVGGYSLEIGEIHDEVWIDGKLLDASELGDIGGTDSTASECEDN